MDFTDLLISFNKDFYMDEEKIPLHGTVRAMNPALVFISKLDEQRFEFSIPRTDIYDYSNGKNVESINNMVSTLRSVIRDYKINGILDDNIQ